MARTQSSPILTANGRVEGGRSQDVGLAHGRQPMEKELVDLMAQTNGVNGVERHGWSRRPSLYCQVARAPKDLGDAIVTEDSVTEDRGQTREREDGPRCSGGLG